VAIYEHVEALEWERAHALAGGLLAFSFLVILLTLVLERRTKRRTV
jgi:molybdate transport system permease protein